MHPARNWPGTLQAVPLMRKKNGNPDECLKIVLSCQPPSSAFVTPPSSRYLFPFPTGSSYTNAADSRFGTSSTVTACVRFCSNGEMTPCAPLHVVASLCVLSEPFETVLESVYDTN